MTAPAACPFDGVALDAADSCRRCGASWHPETDLATRAPTAFRQMTPADAGAAGVLRQPLSCPACGERLAPWRIDTLQVWMYCCPACQGWLCPRGTLDTLSRLELHFRRQAAFASFSPEERASMARDIAAEAAEAAPEPELPLLHGLLARVGLPVVTRTRRERIPLVTWFLALTLVAVFISELRGAGLAAAVERMSYSPGRRGLWAAATAVFAHAGWGHLLGNVYFLLAFGDGVEQRAPRWLLLPAFLLSGMASLFVEGVLHPASLIIGASGGVAAVMGACVVLQPRARVVIHLGPLALRLSMRVFFVLELALQILMAALHLPGVAWTAHLVGLALGAGGAACALLLARRRRSS